MLSARKSCSMTEYFYEMRGCTRSVCPREDDESPKTQGSRLREQGSSEPMLKIMDTSVELHTDLQKKVRS